MILQGICKEARGNLEGELARSGQDLATSGRNGQKCGKCEKCRSDTISTISTFFAIVQCFTIFTFLQFLWLEAGQILARIWQDLGNVLPYSISNHDRKPKKTSQNLASFSPDLATIWPDPGKILPEFGQILARFGLIRARSCQSLTRFWPELARI